MNRDSARKFTGRDAQKVGGTKERILETAERLFALNGYRTTSLRRLTAEAEVNLAAVNYHFGSKEALLGAVFERRLHPLNRVRLERLEEVARRAGEDGKRPSVRDVLEAAVGPMVEARNGSEGMRHFITLVGRVMAEPDTAARDLFSKHIREVFDRTLALLGEALPHVSREVLFWRLFLSFTAAGRMLSLPVDFPLVPHGVTVPSGVRETLSVVIPYITGGMEGEREGE